MDARSSGRPARRFGFAQNRQRESALRKSLKNCDTGVLSVASSAGKFGKSLNGFTIVPLTSTTGNALVPTKASSVGFQVVIGTIREQIRGTASVSLNCKCHPELQALS